MKLPPRGKEAADGGIALCRNRFSFMKTTSDPFVFLFMILGILVIVFGFPACVFGGCCWNYRYDRNCAKSMCARAHPLYYNRIEMNRPYRYSGCCCHWWYEIYTQWCCETVCSRLCCQNGWHSEKNLRSLCGFFLLPLTPCVCLGHTLRVCVRCATGSIYDYSSHSSH